MTTKDIVAEIEAAKTAEHEAKMARYRAMLDTADQFRRNPR